MSTKTTPATSVTICDCCGEEAQCDNCLTWDVAYRDFQGGVVAGDNHRRDLCSTCAPLIHKGLNILLGHKGKPPVPSLPHDAVCTFKDGDQWCAVFGDFFNLAESVAGFGPTPSTAVADLKARKLAGT